MNQEDNEQPRGPSMEIKSKYRDAFLSKTLGRVIIVILIFLVGFTMAAVKESRDAAARLDQQSRDIAELKHLLTMAPRGLAETHALKNEIAQLAEIQSQKMNGIWSHLDEARQLTQVPLTLMISAEDAHVLMTTGDIMHDEYTKFAQGFHNTPIANVISQFMQCEKAFMFNLHYLNRKRGFRFESQFMDNIIVSKNTTRKCEYKSIAGHTWDNAPNLDQMRFTAMFTLDKWCGGPCPSSRCFNGGMRNVKLEMTIMEIC
jgi:hypothetical protein